MNLDEYRQSIAIDVPFERPSLDSPEYPDKEKSLHELAGFLVSRVHEGENEPIPDDSQKKRALIRALLTIRPPDPLPGWFLSSMNVLLTAESMKRGTTDAAGLPTIRDVFPDADYNAADKCSLWLGDLTTLGADAIVNAANSELLGCFRPFHGCIDNAIHSAAGPQLREDCARIIRIQGHCEQPGQAKITRAYNLPARFVLHTVGPIWSGASLINIPELEKQLSDCYSNCLKLASRVQAVRTLAFCSISTGVYGFPKESAAEIALGTVNKWLTDNNNEYDKIIFNVFNEEEYAIYKNLLLNSKS